MSSDPAIREALPTDIASLHEIEAAADVAFVDLFGSADWDAAAPGTDRAAQSGFILVAAESASGAPIAFVHVIEHRDSAHLEQVSVIPSRSRQGIGRALVHAAISEATRRGHRTMTLRTFADVPWNAPFYATCGFTESVPVTRFERSPLETEHRLGLDEFGRRVQMTALLQ